MKVRLTLLAFAVVFSISFTGLNAAPLFFDSFETYVSGNSPPSPLDANLDPGSGGVNSAPNGGVGATNGPDGHSGNPWWGPQPANLRVLNTESSILPHSGTNMVRGAFPFGVAEQDRDYFNLAYRLNGSNVYTGNIMLDWWFYDTIGSTGTNTGASDYKDYAAVAYYSNIPTNADYIDSNNAGAEFQSLGLGGADEQDGTFDSTVYQAKLLLVSTNSYNGNGWFNTATLRSVGWHHGRIAVSPASPAHRVNVSFYIDDMANATLTNSTLATDGFNCIQLNADLGNASAYYDDVSFDNHLPGSAVLNIARVGTNVVVTYPDFWVLQSSTNLIGADFVDVTNAVSPYTNSITGSQGFFRLRQ